MIKKTKIADSHFLCIFNIHTTAGSFEFKFLKLNNRLDYSKLFKITQIFKLISYKS